MDWHTSLDEELAAQVIEPGKIVNFGYTFHVMSGGDGAVNGVFRVKSIYFWVD